MNEQIRQLEAKIEAMRSGQDIQFNEMLRRLGATTVAFGEVSNATANENETTSVPNGGGNVTHAEAYDKRVAITINGTTYYVGIYNS